MKNPASDASPVTRYRRHTRIVSTVSLATGSAPGTLASSRRTRPLRLTPPRYPGIVWVVPTHAVTNQVPPLPDYNTVDSQPALHEGLRRWASPAAYEEVCALGARAGSSEARTWAVQANTYEPVLRTHAATGERADEVEFHPAWHSLMEVAVGAGLTAEPWTRPAGIGRPPAPCGRVHRVVRDRAGSPLPGLHDVCRGAGSGLEPRPRRALGPPARLPLLRLRSAARWPPSSGAIAGHGDDREAGRLRRPRQHDAGGGGARAARSRAATPTG